VPPGPPKVPPRSGRLTESPNSRMIHESARRGVSTVEPYHRSPDAPGQGNQHRTPLRLPTPSRARARVHGRDAAPGARSACGTREPEGNTNQNHDDSNHDHLGRRSFRGDAPDAPPQPHRDPTLLQHQRLHQLPRRRSDDRSGNLPDLRVHAPTPLDCNRPDWRGELKATPRTEARAPAPTRRRSASHRPEGRC